MGSVVVNCSTNKTLTHAGGRMSTEIPIWVNGKIRWLSGIDKKTTCKDIVEILLEGEGIDKSEAKDFVIMERWRKVERPLDDNSKIFKIWSHWGNEKKEVRLWLRQIENEVDSGRGSPTGNGNTPSLRRKRNRARGNGKPPWTHPETLHPRRLAELRKLNEKEYDNNFNLKMKQSETENNSENLNDTFMYDIKFSDFDEINGETIDIKSISNRKKSKHKSYQCSGTGRLHSTLLSGMENRSKRTSKCCSKKESKQKVKSSENIEKLMKLILVQGATIQNQLQKLREREEQIELLENERHRERIEKDGRNYLLETYLGSLKDAEIPIELKEKNDDLIEENDQISPCEKESLKRLKYRETEINPNENIKINDLSHSMGQRMNYKPTTNSSKLQKTSRSKSESRTQKCRSDTNLKRTLSENAIPNISDLQSRKKENLNFESDNNQTAKEELEEVVELKRIQNQIEMWEKVFKINKKLEKEEENLVRLHIKIKKFQSENYRIVKEGKEEIQEKNDFSAKGLKDTDDAKVSNTNFTHEQESVEIQNNLECLRSNLEENSKEIYKNFSKLIQDDEIVEQKRTCLTKLISDLEKMDKEHVMLSKMVTLKEKQNVNRAPVFREDLNSFENNNVDNYFRNNNVIETNNTELGISLNINNRNMCSSSLTSSDEIQNDLNQRTVEQEKNHQFKPKILKISFEDQTKIYEPTNGGQENLPKDSKSNSSGALKSILKNKKYINNKEPEKVNLCNENHQYQEIPKIAESGQNNFRLNYGCVSVPYNYSADPNQISFNDSCTIPYSHHNNLPIIPDQISHNQKPPTKFFENLQTTYPLKNFHSPVLPKTSTNIYPHSTIITTKALVHNDTDSSTSSDTSGLSSMYSSSPTVEEHYTDQSYTLDTLV